jgi:hypothetical protein
MWSETQLAYLAGIIDGEGSIYIQKIKRVKSPHFDVRFNVTNTDKTLIDWLQSTFGGLVYHRNGCNERCKDRYEWVLSRKNFDIFSKLIQPYIVAKKYQLEIAISIRQTYSRNFGSNGVPPEILKFREECLHKMRSINKKGK